MINPASSRKPFTLFISDLHLEENEPATTQAFLEFLATTAKDADALYILGDFFEAWVGDNKHPFSQKISSALKELSAQNIKIYFMPGNRDFLLSKDFTQYCGMSIIPDTTTINLYNHQILLSHGDRFCDHDKFHQLYRKITQNFLFKKLFLSLPLIYRKKIARYLRNKSQRRVKGLPQYIMDVNSASVKKYMTKVSSNLFIHGHTHRPAIHRDDNFTRIVLGAWHDRPSYLIYYADGSYDLVK